MRMAFLWLRNDARLFGVVFVVFNVLLAVFNILNYRVTSTTSVPCVVIVAPTSPPLVKDTTDAMNSQLKQLAADSPRTMSDIDLTSHSTDSPASDTDTGTEGTPSTRILKSKRASVVPSVILSLNSSVWDIERRDKYLVVKNYIPADGPTPAFNASVTLSTQGTFEFLDHVQLLCSRWDGPITVSVYAPGTDMPVAVRKILFLRQCGLPCVRLNVSWSIIYDSVIGPSPGHLGPPNETAEMDVYGPFNCSAGMVNLDLVSEIRKAKRMPYPINVARNVARLQAKTKYVLASDIELYPSLNIVSRFLRLVANESEVTAKSRHLFTLPIFEVKKELAPPETKSELIRNFKNGNAIFFHKWICDSCQSFPRRDEWLKSIPSNDSLSVFQVTKRHAPRTSWEPIYIGTNAEPLYDERLTWEGKRDKMSQMYELCLLDYDFHILDNAFLVHAPGIKTMKWKDQQNRAPFMVKNNAIHNKLLALMRKKYGPKKGC